MSPKTRNMPSTTSDPGNGSGGQAVVYVYFDGPEWEDVYLVKGKDDAMALLVRAGSRQQTDGQWMPFVREYVVDGTDGSVKDTWE